MDIQPSDLPDLIVKTVSIPVEEGDDLFSETDRLNQDQILKQSLQALIDLNSNYNNYSESDRRKDHLSKELLSDLASILKFQRPNPQEEYLQLVKDVFEQIVSLWTKVIPDDCLELNALAIELFKFEDKSHLILEERITHNNPLFIDPPNQGQKAWIDSLKKGDEVDCIKMDFQTKWKCWSHATVVDISEEAIAVSCWREDEKNREKKIDKISAANLLAPFQTRCTDFEWRMNLKKGDTIDVCDTVNVWYNSVVVDIKYLKDPKEDREQALVLVGYRIYHENGKHIDIVGKRYSGWSQKWDEWINVTSPRIQKLNSLGRLTISNHRGQDLWTNTDLIFSNDEIYRKEQIKLYALPKKNLPMPFFGAKLINKFGHEEGFDRILKRILDTGNWAPMKVIVQLVSIISNVSKFLHRDFSLEYIPELKDAIWSNLLERPQDQLKDLTPEYIRMLIEILNPLFIRVYTLPEQHEIIETFTLDLYTLCLNSPSLETKIQGVELLTEALLKEFSFMKPKYIIKHIIENDVLDKIYGSRGHAALVAESERFLRLLLDRNTTSTKDIKLFWDAFKKGNENVKAASYELLTEHIETFNLYLIGLLGEFILSEIDQLSVTRLNNNPSGQQLNTSEKRLLFFGNYIISILDSNKSKNIDLKMRLEKMIEDWKEKQGLDQLMSECLSNIEQRILPFPSILMLESQFTNSLNHSDPSDNQDNRKSLEKLFSENNLVLILIKDLITTIKELPNSHLMLNTDAEYRIPVDAPIKRRFEFIFNILPTAQETPYKNSLTTEIIKELCKATKKILRLNWDILTTKSEDDILPTLKDLIGSTRL